MDDRKKDNGIIIVTAMPTTGRIHPGAAKRYFDEMSRAEGHTVVRLDPAASSLLAHSFNNYLCFALNLRDEGKATHFAMLHDDIEPDAWWLDTLLEESERVGADWISAVSPIKDVAGVTSTALEDPEDRYAVWARFTMFEASQMPETFSADMFPNLKRNLLLNTGCMLIDLRKPWWSLVGDGGKLEAHFEINNEIVYRPGMGWTAKCESEDWFLSRVLNRAGAKLFATTKVKLKHWGQATFPNDRAWGLWKTDQGGTRSKKSFIHEHGYWLDYPADSELYDEGLCQAIVDLCKRCGWSVADLGCGKGYYTKALQNAGVEAVGCDGTPSVVDLGEGFAQVDLSQEMTVGRKYDCVLCLEVGEHVPQQYEAQFLDNIAAVASDHLILSWAVPDQPGYGHVNCRDNQYITDQLRSRGFERNTVIEELLKSKISRLPYLQKTLMAFDRVASEVGSAVEQQVVSLIPATIPPPYGDLLTIIPPVTYGDLVEQTLVLAGKLPPTITHVVGIPRKGLLPASILATRLHLPLVPLKQDERLFDNHDPGEFLTHRKPFYGGDKLPCILVVDDATGTGRTVRSVVEYIMKHSNASCVTAAVYVTNPAYPGVDYWAKQIEPRQYQEAEFLNTLNASGYAVDLDGVICANPVVDYENEDEAWWTAQFANAIPLYLPRLVPVRAIMTSRLEKYRQVTEEWLDRWGVKYRELIMHPAASALARDQDPDAHGVRKGNWYAKSDAYLFVESAFEQARQIYQISGKAVFCTAKNYLGVLCAGK